jgi:hypothetical protein
VRAWGQVEAYAKWRAGRLVKPSDHFAFMDREGGDLETGLLKEFGEDTPETDAQSR